MTSRDRIEGALLGTAIGDALGLPFEGLSPQRIERRLERRPLAHSLLPGRGMVSDDSEHAAMVAEALIVSAGQTQDFARELAKRLRRWLAALPPGVGLATARGILRSSVGFGPARSGVHSAGNGPAMRAALLGLIAPDDAALVALVRASTRITHTDPRAEQGARLVARWARDADMAPQALVEHLADIEDPAFRTQLQQAAAAARLETDLDELRTQFGWTRGVSGFIVDTLTATTYCWLRYGDQPRAALEAAIRLGGDTDTVAAIVGALVGARVGASGLPEPWISGIRDWPVNPARMRELSLALSGGPPPRRLYAPWLGSLARNMALLAVVIAHLLMRLLGR